MDKRVKVAADLIAADLRRELPLAQLVRHVSLSPSRLRYLFKSEIGMTPSQYLKLLRVQRAKKLIKTSFLTMKEIGLKVGFNDKSRFTRAFKKAYGLTPMQYREAYRRHDLAETAKIVSE